MTRFSTVKLLALAGTALFASPVLAQTSATPRDLIPTPTETSAKGEIMAEELTLDRVFESPSLSGETPTGLKLSPDGSLLTSLRPRAGDNNRYDLWARDLATGKETMLVDSLKVGTGAELSEAEKMQRERARIGSRKGIITYQWSPDGQAILVPLDGDLYLANRKGETVRLTDSPEGELNPAISPKGGYVSFVRDGALYVGDAKAASTDDDLVRITPEESSDTVSWGTAEFVAQEEMDRSTGYWWSPDDSRVAVQRTDEARVGIVSRAAIGADGTKVFDQRYPAAGTDNALVELFVMDADGENRVKVDLGDNDDIYLARVHWAADGKTLYVERENREQTVLDMLSVNPATGASKILFSEKSGPKSWVNLSNNFRALKDGKILWWSERSGHGHLYLFDPKAKGKAQWQPLTKGNWEVADVEAVDQKKGLVYFTGNADGPLERHLYRTSYVSNDVQDPERLTESGYWHGVTMDGGGQHAIISRSSDSQPSQVYLADMADFSNDWIVENKLDAGHPYAPYLASHQQTTFGTIKAEDGTDLHYYMIAPDGAGTDGKAYPVWMQHYGGPHAQRVTRAWKGPLPQYIVDQGYIYFELDNRGTANRGKAFEDHIWRAMGSVEVDDQLAGVDYLKSLPYVDGSKIATNGWSYGGYMTLKLLEAAPGTFAAGVAGAPVTDWKLYDTHYTERYMGDPRKVPKAYETSGALAESGKIDDPLLLIHGLSDDNVVFDNSSKLIAKMQADGQIFDMALYPGRTHSISGAQLYGTILRFLAQNLED